MGGETRHETRDARVPGSGWRGRDGVLCFLLLGLRRGENTFVKAFRLVPVPRTTSAHDDHSTRPRRPFHLTAPRQGDELVRGPLLGLLTEAVAGETQGGEARMPGTKRRKRDDRGSAFFALQLQEGGRRRRRAR